MSLRKKRRHYFGDSQSDIREYLVDHAHVNRHTVEHFADAVCKCGHRVFGLLTDEDHGVAVRICAACEERHPMGDSAEYLDEANPAWHSCLCKGEVFEITVGVALYDDSEDVRWLYVGCRCPQCGLTGCYGDWKNEFEGYQRLLAMV